MRPGFRASSKHHDETDIDYAEVVREVTVPCGELIEVELVLTPVDG